MTTARRMRPTACASYRAETARRASARLASAVPRTALPAPELPGATGPPWAGYRDEKSMSTLQRRPGGCPVACRPASAGRPCSGPVFIAAGHAGGGPMVAVTRWRRVKLGEKPVRIAEHVRRGLMEATGQAVGQHARADL